MRRMLYTALCVIACMLVTIGMISRKNAGTSTTNKEDEYLESLLTSAFLSNGTESILSSTTANNVTIIEDLKSIFSSVSSVSDIKRRGSPQNKAFQWIIEDIQQSSSRWTDDDYGEQVKERYILAVFYYSTNGPEWEDQVLFLSHFIDICSWKGYLYNFLSGGVTCNDGSITLSLQLNNLQGHVPRELGKLSRLYKLDLSGNKLSGTIPLELIQMSNLTSLDLSSNYLKGQVPTELGNMSSLQDLNLLSNKFKGTLPSELSQLSRLTEMSLGYNHLEGEIPTELGLMSGLKSLYLHENEFEGKIPSELGMLSNLSKLHLSGNNLSGTIPTSFSNLTNLSVLRLHKNNLEGDADFLCSLRNLEQFWADVDKVHSSCAEFDYVNEIANKFVQMAQTINIFRILSPFLFLCCILLCLNCRYNTTDERALYY